MILDITLKKRITLIFSILGFVSFVFVIFYKYVNDKYHTAQNNITEHNHLLLKVSAIHNAINYLDTMNNNYLETITAIKETKVDVNRLYYTFFDYNQEDTLSISEHEQEVYLSHRNDVLLVYDIKINFTNLEKVVADYVFANNNYNHKLSQNQLLSRMKSESSVLLSVIEDDLAQIEPYYKSDSEYWLLVERYILYLFFVILFSLTVYAGFHLYSIVIVPIRLLHHFITSRNNGPLLRKRGINDEIGDVVRLSMRNESEIVAIRKHLRKISDGELDVPLSLGENALHPLLTEEVQQLQERLITNKIQNERYNWGVEGLSLINETLNQKFDTIEELVESTLSALVKYTKARQGAIFVTTIVNDEEVLLPKAVYAYGVKKKVSQVIHKGEGLLGEVWEERKTFYYKDIPKSHMRIKSGLGDAEPTNLLLTPLISGLEFYGALELGFFHQLQQHEIEFIDKVAVNLAIALSGIDVHNKTKMLLLESQALSSSLQDKESELEAKIQQLRETHEETQRRELQNQRDITLLSENYEQQIQNYTKKEAERAKELEEWKAKVELAKTDNDVVRSLKEEISMFKPQLEDLKETIKIKDMRIDKLRKKIKDSKTNSNEQ